MGSQRLKEHYDAKHAVDLDLTELEIISLDVRRPTHRVEAAVKVLRDRLPVGASVLEIGAGDGRLAESLRLGGVEISSYTLVELSETRLEGLRKHLDHESYRFVQGDIEDCVEVVDGQVDAVVMVALIEHLIDPIQAMRNVRRLLKPGGIAYVDTPNIAKWTRRLKLLFGQFPSTAADDEGLTTYEGGPVSLYDEGHLHYFSYRSLGQMLTEYCGFSGVERFGYHTGPKALPLPLGDLLARRWPAMFGELAVVARVDR
jgi:ubiquinone/menaquinone biosynthesis C-methylase UbiE